MKPSYLQQAAEAVHNLQSVADKYRAAARKLSFLAKKAQKELEAEDIHAAGRRLAQALDIAKSVGQIEGNVREALTELEQSLLYAEEQYDTIVRNRCQELHPEWDVQGSAKRYVVNDLIDVRVDFREHATVINGRRLRSVSPTRVIQSVEVENTRLWGGPFDGPAMLQEVFHVYQNALELQSKSLGEYVRLRDVKEAIERRLGRMDRIHFGALLSRLLRSGSIETPEGWRLHLAPVRSPSDSFPISAERGSGRESRGLFRFYREEA